MKYSFEKKRSVILRTILIISVFLVRPLCSHAIMNGVGGYVGDCVASFALAKVLSRKYNIPLHHSPFGHSDLFKLDDIEQKVDRTAFKLVIRVQTEADIVNNLSKDNVLFWTDIRSSCHGIQQEWLDELRDELQPKDPVPFINEIPQNVISVAVHIRKGDGGGEHYDGTLSSPQLFNYDHSVVTYLTNYPYHPFDWVTYRRPAIDRVAFWEGKFPPEQYYVDQIIKISNEVGGLPLFVQIFTDDKNPQALVGRIQAAVNKPNITFFYQDNRHYSFGERIIQDMYNMSRFDVLIRSQSYFSRAVELMGNHKVVIAPFGFKWLNALVMTRISIKGSISALKTNYLGATQKKNG